MYPIVWTTGLVSESLLWVGLLLYLESVDTVQDLRNRDLFCRGGVGETDKL